MTSVDQKQTEAIRQLVPFAAALDVEVITSSSDEVRARVEWRPERCTTAGVLHGGVIMSLADTTGATCAFQNLPGDAVEAASVVAGEAGAADDQFLEIDHIVPLEHHGHTEIDNLWRLCSHHHRLKTYAGWKVIAHNGVRNLAPPDDPDPP